MTDDPWSLPQDQFVSLPQEARSTLLGRSNGRLVALVPTLDDSPLPPDPESDTMTSANPLGLFVDVAALLADGLPEPLRPVLLTRRDGHPLFYAGQVNVVFGDPESGKTWIAYAAVQEALDNGHKALIIDLDHNGATQVVGRLQALGVPPEVLADPDRFRLAEPEDAGSMLLIVSAARTWGPAVVVVDSIGELVALFGSDSNSPDDWTTLNRRTLAAFATAGAVVICVDHLPKGADARAHGQTGTMAKRRAIGGVSLRVDVREPFAPGYGGAAGLTVAKDRPGGVRAHCPQVKDQPAGIFVLEQDGDHLTWHITAPNLEETPRARDDDLAELDALSPAPTSVRDVRQRLHWGTDRARIALATWRERVRP